MRILAGSLRGRPILEPTLKRGLRPMREAVRAALFSILNNYVRGARFLDLFAGTGSVGLEALSRGAVSCVFVDASAEACRIIRKNLENLGLRASVYQLDAFKAIELFRSRGWKFDLVFLGPPYGKDLAHQALAHLAAYPILKAGALVVAEIFKKESTQEQYGLLESFDERVYGDNRLCFYRWGSREYNSI